MESKLLTVTEVADLCRTSPETVRYWRHIGTGPVGFKVGRRVLYDAAVVESWLDGLRRGEEQQWRDDRAWMNCSRCGATGLTVVEITRDHGALNDEAAPCEATK